MAKFILSVGDSTFKILASEARRRDVSVQQLLRAVIVPEWARENIELDPDTLTTKGVTLTTKGVAPHLMHESIYPSQRDQYFQTPVNRLKT